MSAEANARLKNPGDEESKAYWVITFYLWLFSAASPSGG